jgi:predicted Zn finger-like uncharacterized protein
VIIRCEKCSTVYELDDKLIPSSGAPVQCSRCEHVFRAFPEKKPEPRLELVPPPPATPVEPATEEPAWAERSAAPGVVTRVPTPVPSVPTPVPTPPPELSPPFRAVEKTERTATPVPTPAPEPSPSLRGGEPRPPASPPSPARAATGQMTADGRPIRKVPNPELEGGEAPTLPMGPRTAISYEVGPKKKQTGRWLIGGSVALLLALGLLGAWLAWREKVASRPVPVQTAVDPAAARVRQDGLALLARDDAASLEKAASLLDEAVRKEKSAPAHADRALALALLSQEARDEADRLSGRARAVIDERSAAEAVQDQARVRALTAEVDGLQAGVAPARERTGRLASEARAELDTIAPERQREPIVLRARAMTLVASGQRAEAARIARDAKGLVQDPWLDLAGVLADLPENAGADEHARALDRLEKLAQAHPEIVRARFLAARIRAGMGDLDGALAGLDAVLTANPDHLEAKRLRTEIAAQAAPPPEVPPPPTADVPAAQPAPASSGNPAAQQRNRPPPIPLR